MRTSNWNAAACTRSEASNAGSYEAIAIAATGNRLNT
jgi:hypothetical protein